MSLFFKKVVLMALVISMTNLQAGNSYGNIQVKGDIAGFAAGLSISGICLLNANIERLSKNRASAVSHAANDAQALRIGIGYTAEIITNIAEEWSLMSTLAASLAINVCCHMNENAHYSQNLSNITQPVLLGASTGLILGHGSNISKVAAATLVTSYALAKKYSSDENRARNSWGIAGLAALTAGIKYSSDNGTEVSLFGIPVWKSAQTEQTAPAA